MENKVWVFAYGSLIWNNESFQPLNTIKATLKGANRSFNKKSIKSRGTKSKPGLALGLELGGNCLGTAIQIYESHLPELKKREGGYLPIETPNKLLKVIDNQENPIKCLVFFPDGNGKNYLSKNVSIEEKAEIIKEGEEGDNGNARDYLKEIHGFLQEYDIEDENIKNLYKLVFC